MVSEVKELDKLHRERKNLEFSLLEVNSRIYRILSGVRDGEVVVSAPGGRPDTKGGSVDDKAIEKEVSDKKKVKSEKTKTKAKTKTKETLEKDSTQEKPSKIDAVPQYRIDAIEAFQRLVKAGQGANALRILREVGAKTVDSIDDIQSEAIIQLVDEMLEDE